MKDVAVEHSERLFDCAPLQLFVMSRCDDLTVSARRKRAHIWARALQRKCSVALLTYRETLDGLSTPFTVGFFWNISSHS